jgi:hypothetical protein
VGESPAELTAAEGDPWAAFLAVLPRVSADTLAAADARLAEFVAQRNALARLLGREAVRVVAEAGPIAALVVVARDAPPRLVDALPARAPDPDQPDPGPPPPAPCFAPPPPRPDRPAAPPGKAVAPDPVPAGGDVVDRLIRLLAGGPTKVTVLARAVGRSAQSTRNAMAVHRHLFQLTGWSTGAKWRLTPAGERRLEELTRPR